MNDPNDTGAGRARWLDHVLGLLDGDEAAALEGRLARSEGPDVDALRRDLEVLADLALAGRPVPPPPRLKERLLAAVRAAGRRPDEDADVQIWRRWRSGTSEDCLSVLRAGEGEFEPTSIEGILARRLAFDEAAGRVTMMVRMAPGTRYPPHRHAGAEECYVLSGDLRHRGQVMTAGDFERAGEGSVHDEQWTEGGCLLLIHSSVNDELVPG